MDRKLYDSNVDYMEEMKKRAAAGDNDGFLAAQTKRNLKIADMGGGYSPTKYTMSDFAKENGIAGVPAVRVTPAIKPYNVNTNYTQESIDAAKRGDIPGAMYNERMHNVKDGDMGLGYGPSGIWNYLDMQGLGGRKEAKYREIENYFNQPFDYDYRNDEEYKAIRNLKENEAQKAYNDGYAALSRQFDGDIPVNMINKLLTTKSEITDQADSYILTLKQMAYDMHMNKGNQLYNQYGLLDSLAQEDYQKFLNDRSFIAQGVNDAYTNEMNREERDYERAVDSEQRSYVRDLDRRNWIYDMAAMEFNADPKISWEEAMKRAEQRYGY